MKLSTQPYKGTRDFYPEDMRFRKWMFGKWRNVCEQFGYEEYDGPVLEPLDLYASKTSDEIVNEQTYSFTDRGDRKVVMRPEMTPTVSRMVAAKRQELAYPLRMYSIPNCFRYERPQRGRLREFWQLNVDIFGIDGIEAEIEMMLISDALMKSFGATVDMYEIRVNSRVLLNKRIETAGIKTGIKQDYVIRLIDGMNKMPSDEFARKLAQYVEEPDVLLGFFAADGATEDFKDLKIRLEQAGITNVKFDPTIARGFDYYTDIVFEVFDKDPENNRAMFGGGRYDGLVGIFGVDPVPTVGFGMGDVTFANFLISNNLVPELESCTDLYLATIGNTTSQAQTLAQTLRAQGINVAVDPSTRKIDKQIKSADKKGIDWVLFLGEEELKSTSYKLKNIQTGQENIVKLEEIPNLIKGD